MSTFNLIDEKWIPVRFLDGRRGELGIRETLLRAREIAAIEDPSPLVVAALHRFLLAVLYRALQGPTDIEQARSLFETGMPAGRIVAYLEKWRDRFWLFHEKYPFGQIPSFQPKTWRAWTVLATEHNADNAKVLFDHVDLQNCGEIPCASATRWLLAVQTFSVSAGKSELAHTETAPSATAAMVIPLGHHLQDTLVFSLVPQNMLVVRTDLPIWEREPESLQALIAGAERPVTGLADRYTWRARSIRMRLADSDLIGDVGFASGVSFSGDQSDPMLAYRIDDKKGRLPLQFRARGLWRDFDSLLPDGSRSAPLVVEHATTLARGDRKRFPRTVTVFGQANNKAKIEFWRMERFALPGALAGRNDVRTEIRQLLKDSEDAQKALWSACRSFARDLLSRGERDPAGKDISNFVSGMGAISAFWSTLEVHFHEVLHGYTLDRDPEDIRRVWLRAVRDALHNSWEQDRASVSTGDAWAIRALAKAERFIRQKQSELNKGIAGLSADGKIA